MLDELLTKEDCKKCKSCCTFQEDELIDAPTFDEEAKNYINTKVDKNIKFIKKNDIYQIVLNPWGKVSKCPLLGNNGCILKKYKPFDCESWPFYVMKYKGTYVITISNDCPVFNKIPSTKLLNFIEKKFKYDALKIINEYPNMITDYNRDLKIIYKIGEIEHD